MSLLEKEHKDEQTIKVWDVFVRVFHWSLVFLFTLAWFSYDDFGSVHEICGYSIGVLLLLRIVWGFIGSKHAKFSNFIYRPGVIIGFIRESMLLKAKRYIGHNPAGGAMVIALLLMITSIVISGHIMTMDRYWGAQWAEELHEFCVNTTLILVVLHVAGVVLASIEHNENLAKAMLSGLKRSK